MAFLFTLFTVALSVCVVGLIVLALSSILRSVRDGWKSKKLKREPPRESTAAVNPRQFRIMTKVEVSGPEVFKRWKTEAAANCAPLYIQDAFLFDGHDASTKNATSTCRRDSQEAARDGQITVSHFGARPEERFYQSFLYQH
jgi:hypothetical protein